MTKELVGAHWFTNEARRPVGRQPKYPIARGELPDVLDRSQGAANDNQLIWPFIPFPDLSQPFFIPKELKSGDLLTGR
jgi:hypothetical protein